MTNRAAFMQAIRGPVLLAALGVLFALDQAGTLYFRQTWPLLIILFGVLKLLEKSAEPQVAAPPFAPAPPRYHAPVQGQPPTPPFHYPGGSQTPGGSRPAGPRTDPPSSSGEPRS